MSTLPTVLFVDGACRGNPGVGGWGVYIEHPTGQKEHLCGGEKHTTNNRMELMAAIAGIEHLSADLPLLVWTDSSYVQKGISEWIDGWKRKNWRKSDGAAVMNADLWQLLDKACQGRHIDWRWIKGHAGHYGNEMADQLANKGADSMNNPTSTAPTLEAENKETEKKEAEKKNDVTDDWLTNDPLGLDAMNMPDALLADEASLDDAPEDIAEEIAALTAQHTANADTNADNIDAPAEQPLAQLNTHAAFNDTTQAGKRYLILDTETTGFDPAQGDRMIEIGAFEMIDRKLTGKSLHQYINPKRKVGDSENIHGLSDEFLKDKPTFDKVAADIAHFIAGAGIIAHNAQFDMRFLHAEFSKIGQEHALQGIEVIDTLAIAKQKHPTQKNSLDALVKRYDVVKRDRTYHGALLDAEILADVYLAMTGGQVTLAIEDAKNQAQHSAHQTIHLDKQSRPAVIMASENELGLHQAWVNTHGDTTKKANALWHQLSLLH